MATAVDYSGNESDMAKFETCSVSPRFVASTTRTIAIASLCVWSSIALAQISPTLEVDRDTLRIGGYENLTEKAELLAFEGRLIAAVAAHEKCKDYAEHEFNAAHWAVVEARHQYDQAVRLGSCKGPERELALQLYSNWQEGIQADRKGNRAEASRRCSLALENASRLGQDDTIVVAEILVTHEMQLESDDEKAKALVRIVSIYERHRCELHPTAIAARIKLADAHLQKDILQAES